MTWWRLPQKRRPQNSAALASSQQATTHKSEKHSCKTCEPLLRSCGLHSLCLTQSVGLCGFEPNLQGVKPKVQGVCLRGRERKAYAFTVSSQNDTETFFFCWRVLSGQKEVALYNATVKADRRTPPHQQSIQGLLTMEQMSVQQQLRWASHAPALLSQVWGDLTPLRT